jgi:FkbM family methyltransferase
MVVAKAQWARGGNVPGGHYALRGEKARKPFITPMRECNSIPLRYSDRVVDIGAYVGTYALRCARYPVQQVTAYEPTPYTMEVLTYNRQHLPNLHLVQAAIVGHTHGSSHLATLHLSAGIGVTNSLVPSHVKAEHITVPAVSYADAVRDATIVKIDVEGGEYDFPIVQPSLRALIIDFHPIPGKDWIGHASDMIRQMTDAGFETVIAPDFRNGWTRAGSWLRDIPDTGEGCLPLLSGQACCGCGISLKQTGHISLCPVCWQKWTAKERGSFLRSSLSEESVHA